MAKTKAKNADTRDLPGKLNKTVRPVHFEDFGWKEFEHLTYAHIRRQKQWDSLDWFGQSGNDQGRDLWGRYNNESYCYNCANHSQLKLKKITDDIDKLFNEKFIPDIFIVISGGNVSATLKGKIKEYAVAKGIKKVEVYSGKEFEEQLRIENPDLLKRFVDGEEFPELDERQQLIRGTSETPEEVLQQVRKYRSTKKMEELESIINRLFLLDDFENRYGEKLEELIFNDTFLIEYFASNAPDILIEFSKKYPGAAINNGDHLFHILSGLFSDKSNPIYTEIRQYKNEKEKEIFLNEYWLLDDIEFKFNSRKNYQTALPIISWLSIILGGFPPNLKEDTKCYLNRYPNLDTAFYNKRIFSEKEINLTLTNDNVFNSIQLFRSLLIETTFTNERSTVLIDRILLLFYSSWDFVFRNTKLESGNVALDNDAYTINEYQLKYLFHGYLTLIVLQELAAGYRISDIKENKSGRWIVKQLFMKIDKLISSSCISDHSKKYYVTGVIGFYFRLPRYFNSDSNVNIEEVGNALIWHLRHSMTESSHGNPAVFQSIFKQACNSYEFYRDNNEHNIERAKLFYTSLLPFTADLEYRIVDI